MKTSRQLVYDTLALANPERAARQLWDIAWTHANFPEELQQIKERFPDDIVWCPRLLRQPLPTTGAQYAIGQYTDEWGCLFENRMDGIIGEVKKGLITDEEWSDWECIQPPQALLALDTQAINEFCRNTDQFVLANSSVRILERLQFFAGTDKLLMDLLLQPEAMFKAIQRTHAFFCAELEAWAKTEVDALFIQDDWGTQISLLISPALWVEIFKPLYADYARIAKAHGKKLFMHSDGYIVDIIPHLIEVGVDALNSQIFCMGLEKLERFRGSITFWGEMDRQYLLTRGTPQEVRDGVAEVKRHLWKNGGCIAQLDFGVGAKPENVSAAFEAWEALL